MVMGLSSAARARGFALRAPSIYATANAWRTGELRGEIRNNRAEAGESNAEGASVIIKT